MIRRLLGAVAALAITLPAAAQATTLIDNIEGITIDREGEVERFTGMILDDGGRVLRILDADDPRPRTDYRTDGEGRTIVPGFIDSHAHVMNTGLGLLTLDLSATKSLDEALSRIAAYAAAYPDRPWIVGRGWNQEAWGLGRFPTAEELDSVVPNRPVWLDRVDGHAGWANSAALRAAGITAETADPAGGRIQRKPGSKAPAGVFVDDAMPLVARAVPAPLPEDLDKALYEAQQLYFKNGITAVADMGTSVEDWMAFRRSGDIGTLRLRIASYADGVPNMLLIGGTGPTPWLYQNRLRLNGVKLWLDGALGSRGALLKQDYADDPGNRGLPLMSGTQLRNNISRAGLDNFQVAVHAIGDAANQEALYAMQELSGDYPGDRRWRIEHAQIVDPADIPLFGQVGVVASMQPQHQTSDRVMAEARLGPDRLAGAYAWRSIAATGAPLVFGSDVPVEYPDPLEGMAAAISRTGPDGQPFGGWHPEQTVTREQALAAYTSGGAWAMFADGRFGELKEGQMADFVVLDRDPLLASPEELRQMKVLETWVGGQKVYDAVRPIRVEPRNLGPQEQGPPASGR